MLKFQSKSLSLICLSFLLFFQVPVSADTVITANNGEKITLSPVAKGDSLTDGKAVFLKAVGSIYPGEEARIKIAAHFDEWTEKQASYSSVHAIRATTAEGQSIGILIYEIGKDKDKVHAQIRAIAVEKSIQRQGIGAKMINEIPKLHSEIDEIRADPRKDNPGSQAFFTALGFRAKELPNDPAKSPEDYTGYVLRRNK